MAFIEYCECGFEAGAKELYSEDYSDWVAQRAFNAACFRGKLHIMKWLYSIRTVEISWMHVTMCHKFDYDEIMIWFMELDLDIDYTNELFLLAAKNGCSKVMKLTYRNQDTERALVISCMGGYINSVKWLLDIGVNAMAHDNMPLTQAVRCRYIELVKLLINHNVRVTTKQFDISILHGHIHIAALLYSHMHPKPAANIKKYDRINSLIVERMLRVESV